MIKRILVALAGAALPHCAFATDGDEQCEDFSEQARLACTTTDRNAGSNGEMDRIFDSAEKLNRGVGDSGKCIAELYKNRALSSAAMARMSQLKANACANSLSLCHLHCSSSERLHRLRSEFAEAVDDDEYSSQHRNLADDRKSADQKCVGYLKNVRLAREQSVQYLKALEVNNSGRDQTTAGSGDSEKSDSKTCLDTVLGAMGLSQEDLKSGKEPKPRSNTSTENAPGTVSLSVPSGGAGEALIATPAIPVAPVKRSKIMMGTVSTHAERAPASVAPLKVGSAMKGDRSYGYRGMSIREVDGITGPFGPDLFQKISHQYRLQESSLVVVQPGP